MSVRNCSEEYYRTHASELTGQLYLAACRAVTSKCLLDLGITNIVNATLELPTVAYQKQDTIQIAVEDRVSAKLNIYFDLIADKIQQVHSGGGKILIYCRAGQSRSATLCIAYFMKYHDMTYEQAFQYVKYRRPIIHPNLGFVSQLREYERKLKTKPPTPPPITLNILYAEEAIVDETVDDEVADIPIPPLKHGRPIATIHEPFQTLADKLETVSVQICDKPAAVKTRKLLPEKLSMSVQGGHPVASSRINTRTFGAVKALEPHEPLGRGGPKRQKTATAFTRVTKPNDIAVMYWNIPLDLALASKSKTESFKLQIKPEKSTLAVAELLLNTAISEGLAYELVGIVPKAVTESAKASSSITLPRPCCVQLKCPIFYLNGQIDFVTNTAASKQQPRQQQQQQQTANKIVRQPSVKTKTRSLFRYGSGYQLQPQLNAPTSSRQPQHPSAARSISEPFTASLVTPVHASVRLSDNVRLCTVSRAPPIFWESPVLSKGGEISLISQKSLTVRSLRYALITVSGQSWQTPVNIPIFSVPIDQYHRLDFSFAPFEASLIATKTSQQVVGSVELDCGRKMTVSKEFPYYSTVHFTSALELFRATEPPKLDIQWFKVPEAVKADPVEVIRKSSEARMAERKRRKNTELVVKWATERFQPDEFQEVLTSLAVTKFPVYSASLASHSSLHEAYSLIQVVDYVKLDLIGRFYVPHYNPILLRKTCDPVLHPVALTCARPILHETDVLTSSRNSRLSKSVARKTLHSDCMMASVSILSDTRDEGDCLEDIPDEIHDISEIKPVLATERTDSPRCKIWFEVFKRTLMLKRPTFATVSFDHNLLAPAMGSQHLVLEFVLGGSATSGGGSDLAVAAESAVTLPLGVASAREVTIIEKYSGYSKFSKAKNSDSKKFASSSAATRQQQRTARVISSSEYLVDVEIFSTETAKYLAAPSQPPAPARAVSKVSFPNRLYCVQETQVHGLTGLLDLARLEVKALARLPFSLLTRPRPVVQVSSVLQIGVTRSLPEYRFVQTGAVLNETPAEKTNNPSNFLLFLPDRKYAPQIGHLGQEEFPVAEPEPDKDDDKAGSKPPVTDLSLLNPDVVVAEVLQEIKDQTEEKKVTFAEEPEVEDSPKKQRVRTIYYGRDRSKSRTRLKDVETGARRKARARDSSVSEVEVMRNLARSVDEANNILMRRRDDPEPGRYGSDRVTFSPSPERYSGIRSPRMETRSEERFARRSRDEARNKAETERRERSRRANSNIGGENDANLPNQPSSSSGGSSSQVDPAQGGKGLGGIISFASNLIGGKSRREQSDNRARGLLRKSARNFL